MTTMRDVVEAKRAELDSAWNAKHPDGVWCIQRFHGFGLHWYKHRPVSGHVHCDGVSACLSERVNNLDRPKTWIDVSDVEVTDHRNSSFGKCTYYTSLQSFRKACGRLGIPAELLSAWELAYANQELLHSWIRYNRLAVRTATPMPASRPA